MSHRVFVALAFTCTTSIAWAQSPADLETARLLFAQANELHDRGDIAGALAKYKAADVLAHTPVTALELAKTYVETGQLVLARETALGVASIPTRPNESAKTVSARAEAAKVAAQLQARIPTLTITIEGVPPASKLDVRVDGAAVDQATLGQPRVLDPGSHAIVASVEGGPSTTVNVALDEGASRSVQVHVDPPEPRPSSIVTPKIDIVPKVAPPLPPPPPPTGPSVGLVVTIALGGAGVASFITMAVAGGFARARAATVAGHCNEAGQCDALGLDAAAAGRTFATLANVTLVLGTLFVVSSIVVGIVTHKRSPPAVAVSFAPISGGAMGSVTLSTF